MVSVPTGVRQIGSAYFFHRGLAQFRKLGFEKSVRKGLGEDPVFKVFLAIACLVAGAFALNRADGASNVVQYVYDAAGNIVGIQRLNPAPITFTGFVPTSGPVGTSVAISGTGFATIAAQNIVSFNGVPAAVTAASATALTAVVPVGATNGRITATVAGNTVVSPQDFVVTATPPIVPPGGVAPGDILATARLFPDGPAQHLDLLATGKYGWVLFDGAVGAWMSLHVGTFTINPAEATVAYTVYKPDNTQLASGTLSATNLSIHLPALPAAGTYSLMLRTGIAQVSLDAKLELNSFIPANGTSLAVARSAGQSTRALISGVAGDQKALTVSGIVTTPAGNSMEVTIALPDGSTFRRATVTGLGTTTALPPFAATGTHAVTLVPTLGTTQSAFRIGLLAGVAIAIDGAPADVAIANPGEGARVTFAGVAGENLGLGVSGVVLNPASAATTNVAVYKPDASLLSSVSCGTDGSRCAVNLENLPVSGTYTIIVQPANGATGTQRVWLSHDVGGTLVSGTPATVAISRPGQNARLNFTASAGTLLALQVRGVTTSPPGQGLGVLVSKPDKSQLVYLHLTGAGQTLVPPALPVSGTYTVFIEPESVAQGAATATMELLLDPGRTLVVDGPTLDTTIGVPGGSARYLFAGTAGQNLGFGVSNFALNPAADATVTIYKPDGAELSAFACPVSAGGCSGTLADLPLSGTFGIVVRPSNFATGGFSMTLSSDLGGTLVAGGAALSLTLDRPGRNARIVFAGTAGQTLRLTWSGVTIAGAPGSAYAFFNSSSGTPLGTALIAQGSVGGYDIPALPATGSYILFVDPPAAATLNATLRLVAR